MYKCVLPFADASRGDSELEVGSAEGLVAGGWISLTLSDPPAGDAHSGSLIRHLYAGVSDKSSESLCHAQQCATNGSTLYCVVNVSR